MDRSSDSDKDDSPKNSEGMDSSKPAEGPEKESVSAAVQKPPALENPDSKEPQDLETLFDLYANFGDREGANGITLKNADKWLKQATVLDPKEGISKEDTNKAFEEVAEDKKRIDVDEFQGFVRALATSKGKDIEVMMNKILAAGQPKISSVSDVVSKICKKC